MDEAVTVTCDRNQWPPQILIVIADQQGFTVSEGVYDLISGPLGLPANPCTVIPGSTTNP